MPTFLKDPDAVLDFAFDWSAWLEDGETIVDHEVVAADGITLDSSDADAGVVTFWLSGGTLRGSYRVTCHIVTSAGREDDRSLTVSVRER